MSRAYRWMNKTGGWIWMQTVGTVITRKTANGEENQILCANYISRLVEGTLRFNIFLQEVGINYLSMRKIFNW